MIITKAPPEHSLDTFLQGTWKIGKGPVNFPQLRPLLIDQAYVISRWTALVPPDQIDPMGYLLDSWSHSPACHGRTHNSGLGQSVYGNFHPFVLGIKGHKIKKINRNKIYMLDSEKC